jgi:hypothetical protein
MHFHAYQVIWQISQLYWLLVSEDLMCPLCIISGYMATFTALLVIDDRRSHVPKCIISGNLTTFPALLVIGDC